MAYLASCPVGTGLFPGGKAAGAVNLTIHLRVDDPE
jgi:hypothetical protein